MREEDILTRQTRPQRHSSQVPNTRDWRYATGVFQREDFDTRERSACDTMEFNNHIAGSKRGRKGSGCSNGSDTDLSGTASVSHTPESAATRPLSEPSNTIVQLGPPKKKAKTKKKSKWMQVSRYKPLGEQPVQDEEHPGYDVYSLTVRLRFSDKLTIQDAQTDTVTPVPHVPSEAPSTLDAPAPTLTTEPPTPPTDSKVPATPATPATIQTAETPNTPHTLDFIKRVRNLPPFQRPWIDETQDFNMRKVLRTLRQPFTEVKDLGRNYTWYTSAVPIDTLFPPGIPLSAKEILAYYPHHIRWKGVMIRLTNNNYRGSDIVGIQVSAYHSHLPT